MPITVPNQPERGDRVVCYCMTRNIYDRVIPSLKSLLAHTRIDHVYLLIEDDTVGYPLPDNVTCINVSQQNWFDRSGPNYNCHWSYMVMMRTVLCEIFPFLDRALTLDCDTIVRRDISYLWEISMNGCYLAAVQEKNRTFQGCDEYYNCGAVLWNLDMMRDGKCVEIVGKLNHIPYEFAEQDAVNECCRYYIRRLPTHYNANLYTDLTGPVCIRHYAAEPWWWDQEEVRGWYRAPWVVVGSQHGNGLTEGNSQNENGQNGNRQNGNSQHGPTEQNGLSGDSPTEPTDSEVIR